MNVEMQLHPALASVGPRMERRFHDFHDFMIKNDINNMTYHTQRLCHP